LDALQELAGNIDIHVIVSDNDSQDRTLEVVDRFRTVLNLDVLHNAENLGFARGVNLGLARCRPQSDVLVLNPDVTIPSPGQFEILRGHLKAPTGVVGPLLRKPDGTIDHACARPEPTPLQTAIYVLRLNFLVRWMGADKHWYGTVPIKSGYVDSLSGAFMLIRSDALLRVGGLDERYWMYGEDLDWCRTFREAGFKIYFAREVEAAHIKGASTSSSWTPATLAAFFVSMELYFSKWYDGRLGRIARAPLVIVLRLWEWAIRRKSGKATRAW
jgi:GT2 family glycosyltransferase